MGGGIPRRRHQRSRLRPKGADARTNLRGGACQAFDRPPRAVLIALQSMHRLRSHYRAPASMSSITVRNLDPAIKERLRVRAAERGHSMEAEARRIIQTALSRTSRSSGRSLYDRVHDRFAALGGVDLELPPRPATRDPPGFE